MDANTLSYIQEQFKLTAAETLEVTHYHSGICYSTITVKKGPHTEAIRAKVRAHGCSVIGGWFDGTRAGSMTFEESDTQISFNC